MHDADATKAARLRQAFFSATQQFGNYGYQLGLHFPGAPDVSSVS